MTALKYKVIKDTEQYNAYCDQLEKLVNQERKSNSEEIELLSLLIENYNHHLMEQYEMEFDPVELLVDIIEENQFSQKELAERIQVSPQLINDVLKYRREITKSLAYKLSKEFKLNNTFFLKPYQLKQFS